MGFGGRWANHPTVRSREELTRGERAADVVRNGMGSWPFVFGFLSAMALWAFINSGLNLGGHGGKAGFDPYPYILLNLILSTLAGLQGAILLIAAKRADSISSELAQHDLATDLRTAALLEENTALTNHVKELTEVIHQAVCERRG